MTPIEHLRELMSKAKATAHHLTNCTDDPEGAPYLADEPAWMEARHKDYEQQTGDAPDWDMYDIPLRISDDCQFCTVHGFEGQAQWSTAEAIANAGPVILGMLDHLPALLAVVEAAQSTAYNSEHLGDGTTRCPSEVIDRLRAALAPLTTPKE